jgi:adenosyl cobinamide kinase/adenosyl cobinamide phosphate guanylyltransferase
MLKEGEDIYSLVDRILANNPDIVIIVDELGCGIVPMDPYDRMYRELTGRICCKLAKEAKEVHRVISGIGMVIKHA